MHDKLIGYLLCAIEEEEMTLVEHDLKTNQDFVTHLHTLRLALRPLECCRDGECESPAALAAKTCEKIRQQWSALQAQRATQQAAQSSTAASGAGDCGCGAGSPAEEDPFAP